MLITRIELENIKSYRHFAVDLRRGTTAISGGNGAGKTTLVEAIGYALFDYLPYNHSQFVREGEKYGRVTIHLIGGDERPYIVERRCGSGSRWYIYDVEASDQVDQRADVVDKLHDLFGIERDRPLNSLFKDALGVPQGTFTAIFLESGSKRKQTFDALLQIEDYRTAADYLLSVQKIYDEQKRDQQLEMSRLEHETRELDVWKQQLQEARQQEERYELEQKQKQQQLLITKERFIELTEQQGRLRHLEERYNYQRSTYQNHLSLLNVREQSLQRARAARQIFDASLADYQRYQQASQAMQRLRVDEKARNQLLNQRASVERAEIAAQAQIQNWCERLKEVAEDRQRLAQLEPLVAQQRQLEQQRDDLKGRVLSYKKLLTECQRLQKQLTDFRQRQVSLQQRIAQIEPLQEVAALLAERSETLTRLRIDEGRRTEKEKALGLAQKRLKEKQLEREMVAEKLRKAERNLQIIEERRREAEEVPDLQQRRERVMAQMSRLEGNIEGYSKSRAQAAGGLCPLLNEACLNIRGKGIASLESYFEGLLTAEQSQLAKIRREYEAINTRIGQFKKYADALSKLEQYIEQRDTLAEQVRKVSDEIARAEQEIADLTSEIGPSQRLTSQIREAQHAYDESQKANEQIAELGGLYKQLQLNLELIQQYEADWRARSHEAEALKGSEEQLKQVESKLQALNNPRGRALGLQEKVAKEGQYQQQLLVEQQRLADTHQQLQQLQEALAAYQSLDADIALQEAIMRQSEDGYRQYLQNEQEAQALPERERAYQEQEAETRQAAESLRDAEITYQQAKAAFDEQELLRVGEEMRQLERDLTTLESNIKHHQEKIEQLMQKIEVAEGLREQLEAARREYKALDDLHSMTNLFRSLIKEAAPHVLKAMLNDISAEANRIFSEIMGDRSAQLSWQNDYEITLRRQGVNRTFAQLSGGEQMSAALAIRLALLKKLSNLNIAFFDEPTQNMDELRRTNLAEQIRRVRGFEQLIVISHDDTFEQGLDSIVRLNKQNGETHLLSEEEIRLREEIRVG